MRMLSLLALIWAPSVFAVTTLSNGVQVIHSRSGQTFYTGLRQKPVEFRGLGETHVTLNDCDNLPDEFDLRDYDVVPPIRDQGQCGSCWAFSQTASLESATKAAGGQLFDLSEQQLVSCDTENYGCDGGLLNGFNYQISHGQSLEKSFPYTASDSSCKSSVKTVAQGTDYAMVGPTDGKASEKDVMCAIYKSHTIPWIIVSATDNWSYPPTDSDGLYTQCASGQPNHAIGVIGWKKVDGKVYFKIRNSWGTSWGSDAGRPGSEKGYAMMQLGCDSLGDEVSYIVSKQTMSCMPPLVKLPAEMSVAAGDQAHIAIKAENDVDYTWYQGKTKVGEGTAVDVAPSKTAIYKVVAKNSCGTAESQTRVKVLNF